MKHINPSSIRHIDFEKYSDFAKLLGHSILVIGLVLSALSSFKYLASVADFDWDNELNESIVICLSVFTLLWLGISETLNTRFDSKFHLVSFFLSVIGQMALVVLSFFGVYMDNTSNKIFSSAFGAGMEVGGIMRLVIANTEGSTGRWSILFALVLSVIILTRFYVRIFSYLIAMVIPALFIRPTNIMIDFVFFEIATIIIFLVEYKHDKKAENKCLELNITIEKIDIIVFTICIIAVIVSVILGKVASWTEYFLILFSNDYLEILEVRNTYDALFIVSLLISFTISGLIPDTIKSLIEKTSNKALSPLMSISLVIIETLVNIWILDFIVKFFVRAYMGNVKWVNIFDESTYPQWLQNLDLPAGEMPTAVYVILAVIVCILVLVLGLAVFFVQLKILFYVLTIIGSALVKGFVFMFVAFFANRFFSIDYTGLNVVAVFCILYCLNYTTSIISGNIAERSLVRSLILKKSGYE